MHVLRSLGMSTIFMALCGCAAAPVQQEIQLPSQSLDQAVAATGLTLVVIYNDSNRLMFGVDGSGKINVSLDGKGVGQLSIGKYVIVEVSAGRHTVALLHKDLLKFSSEHEFVATGDLMFAKIYSKTTSNGFELTERPKDFAAEFSAAY